MSKGETNNNKLSSRLKDHQNIIRILKNNI